MTGGAGEASGGADEASSDADEADARFEARRRERRGAAIAALPPEMLVALAGAPFWTTPALAAAGLDMQRYLAAAGAIVLRDGIDEDTTISLEREAVAGVVQHLYARSDVEPAAVLAAFGDRVSQAEGNPPVLKHWARLARSLRDGSGGAANELLARVQALCDANHLGDASELLEAAGALARTVGGQLVVAERIARHRIERKFRTIRDRRHLSCYVEREDAMAAFERLLAEDGPWALHYVGVGGAGKTTFIRHLAVDQAATRGLNIAQIDFDYLSPAYPGRDPGQLVQAIAHELTIHIERVEQDRWLQSIHEQLERLRDVAQEVRPDDPIGPIGWPEFQELLGFVASFLRSFSHPIIVLDTCEELMKLSPVGRTIPSVEASFRLIEELHQRVPQLRVIFAGRRLLAAGGDGWTALPQVLAQPLSAARPYLMLHELRGMTPDEAGAALTRLLPESRREDQRLRKAILDACPEDGRVNGIVHAAAEADAPRFSPFRLVRFGHWVAAEPTLAADRLEHGADPYIEQRVIQHVGALEGLLPTVVLLRRLDAGTLARVRGLSAETARATLKVLAGHEWTYVHDTPQRGIVVEVKPAIRDQLERYLQSHREAELRAAREAIGHALAPVLHAPDAVLQPPELIDAALRAQPGLTAVRAWFALEANIGRDWDSALTLTRFLLGDGNAAEDGATILGCAVRATHLSALIHEHPEIDVAEPWRQITDALEPLEQIATVRMLRCRARLGAVAAEGWRGTADPELLARELEEILSLLGGRPRPFTVPWVIAAVEGLLERLERSYVTCSSLERIVTPGWWVGLPLSPALEAWVAVLRARAAALLGNPRALGDALLHALMTRELKLPATCLDWLPPASLRDRIRLEAMRLHYFYFHAGHAGSTAIVQRRPFAAWIDDLGTEGCTDDGDRLAAAWMQYEAGITGTVPAVSLKVKRRLWGLREPAVYRRFAPAAVTFTLLHWSAATVPAEVSALDAVRIRLSLARRTRDRSLLATEAAQTSSSRVFVETAQAAALVLERGEPVPAKLRDPAEPIDHWSYQRAITHAELASTVDSMRPYVESLAALVRGDDPMLALRAREVLEQVVELARYTREPLVVTTRAPARRPAHPDQIEAVARLELQAAAAQRTFRMPHSLEGIARTMPGAIARLAIEEAELLSLRFPDRAARLFVHAEHVLERLGCRAEAQIAQLGRTACQQMLGIPMVETIEPAVPALAGFAARVNGSGPRFPLVERTRARRATLGRRARAWTRRYADELLLLLGLVCGGIGLVAGWFVLTGLVLPALRDTVPVPETTAGIAITYSAGVACVLLLIRARKRVLRTSALWRWMQVIRPWRYRLALQVLADREGLQVIVDRRDGRETWLAAKPGAGEIPTLALSAAHRGRLAALREEIAVQSPLPVVARADIARAVGAAAWEAPLVAGLHNLVIWRAVPRPAAAIRLGVLTRGIDVASPVAPHAPAYLEPEVARAWLDGCGVTELDAVLGIAHLIGRPRRLVGSIDLERTHHGDRASAPGRSEITARRVDELDVILQLAPQDMDQASLGTRTELGLLRELASSIIDRGARSVLVIPAIAHDHLEAVVIAVARALGRAPERKHRRLIEAARQCRAAIAGLSFADHAIVADEVTLFVAVTDPTPE